MDLYAIHDHCPFALRPWYDWLREHFADYFTERVSTFKRGDSRSCIDYMYGHRSIQSRLTNALNNFLPIAWTEHSLLTADLLPSRKYIDPGAWRFNPSLLMDESFVQLLHYTVHTFFETTQAQPSSRKRSNLLSTAQKTEDKSALYEVEALGKRIDIQTQRDTYHCMLRSATRWHEKREQNNKHFFRAIKERQIQQTIEALRCSSTGTILQRSHSCCQKLYTPDTIDVNAVSALLESIPHDARLTPSQVTTLTLAPSDSDVMDLLQHSLLGKSPGLDGIPFEVYKLLSEISIPFRQLLLAVIGCAFVGIFPPSWQQTRMVLLFKKGDPMLLSNWRPLSLINADTKLFIKLLSNRLNRYLPQLINPYQTGFLPRRLISDNGWLNQTLMSNLQQVAPDLPQVAVLLHQEKAYDWIHPDYLRRVLLHFGFPESLVSSLSLLFFETRISVSINGWLSAPFQQLQGLKQSDLLSPLLFNLAFEPLLRTILSSPRLRGVSMEPVLLRQSDRPTLLEYLPGIQSTKNTSPPPVKLLSYADDLEVFLTHLSEWPVLIEFLTIYGQASNAKQGIVWHDQSSHTSVRYLGYPLYHTTAQLDSFLQDLLLKIKRQNSILRERHLSVRGSSIVANTLILSRLWHLLRVVLVPSKWLPEVRSVVRRFVAPFWPASSWETMYLPRKHGGLGLPSKYDFLTPWLQRSIQLYTGHSSPLPFLLFPSVYLSLVRKVPTLKRLGVLVKKLPRIVPNPRWSLRLLLDLPLSSCLLHNPPISGRISNVIPSSLPLRYTLSDVAIWHSSINQLVVRTTTSTHARAVIRELFPSSGQADATIRFDWYIKVSQDPPSMPASTTMHSDTWPPQLSYWCYRSVPHKQVPVVSISPMELRRSWYPALAGSRRILRPPYRVATGLRIPVSSWKEFWTFDIPSSAFTPWWRLLHDSLLVASTLHRRNVTSCASPVCRICHSGAEDTFHFVVGCPLMWQF
ncbi:hypothetical protein G6F43_006496 [Rhizopus delemar]|nr:hypothetical protein G6F43_006496 [Rhizopus delemar]